MNYHVYALPADLLDTLTPRDHFDIAKGPSRPSSPQLAPATSILGSRACNVCLGATFLDVEEQRAHFRSDWHRYNVKTRLNGAERVSEQDFAKLVDGLEDSISGSASSSSSTGSSDESDAVDALVKKTKKLARSASSEEPAGRKPQTALAWFHSPPSTQIGIYKALFPLHLPAISYLPELKSMQERTEAGRTWAMFMTAGGHFAGAIVQVSRPAEDEEEESQGKRKKPRRPKPDVEVLKHKTFHRYTTRRKQGGSQSVNDNAKSKAKSAGAQLRRYGEQALRDDIRNLLKDWEEDIQDCERIWIRASTSNRRIFLDYNEAVIAKGDDRLRTFPFPTRRPTQSELSRCLLELTRVKVSHLTEEALRQQDEEYLASLPKPKHTTALSAPPAETEKSRPAKLSKEEEALRDKWLRLLEMVFKGRLEALKAFWEREEAALGGVNTFVPSWIGERHRTLLQLAARSGHEDVVHWLLEDARADPTVEVPLDGADDDDEVSDASDRQPPRVAGSRRTAYDLCRTKPVRDVFRRCAGAHPDWWNWFGAAHVPSALTKEMEDERDEKKKVRRKGLKERVKEREAKERERDRSRTPVQEEEPVPPNQPAARQGAPVSGPRKLGGAGGQAEGIAGLTPEMRAKVERERRARAAEARLAKR